jgi:hypothetical protein
LRAAVEHHPAAGVVSDRRLTRRSGPMVSALCGLLLFAVAEPVVTAADTFDGVYTGTRVLKDGSDPACPTSDDDVSVAIRGAELTFTNSELRNFVIGFAPHQDGTFSQIYTDVGGGSVLIRGRIEGGVLDADVANGPCQHHWRLTKRAG